MFGRTGLIISKYSPEILQGVGLVTMIGSVVSAGVITANRAEDILENHRRKMEEADEAVEIAEEDGIEYDPGREKFIVFTETAVDFVKAYAPTIGLTVVSAACFLTANHIIKTRYLGAVAAFNAVSEAFAGYRSRIREEYGEEADRFGLYGEKKYTVETCQMDPGKDPVMSKTTIVDDVPPWYSPYAKIFDSSCPDWDKNATFNMTFLKGQEAIANNLLHTRGHVFLNEVYEMLGFNHTSVGAVVGWIDGGSGDSFIDFGIFNHKDEATRRFVNGLESNIILDFNVDGVIYDKI